MSGAEQVAAGWRALGRQLAASRRAAELSQEQLAALADYSRSTVANVETGRQHVDRDFWAQCDRVLRTGDALRRGYREVEAAARSERAQAVALARYDSLSAGVGRGRRLLFQDVPEGKTVKNRLHIDVHSEPGGLNALVDRLEGLGATRVREVDQGPAGRWWTMRDPEGNEFDAA